MIRIVVQTEEDELTETREIARFLWDLDALYSVIRLATDKSYGTFRYSAATAYRRTFPLRPEDRLRVRRLTHESPLSLEMILTDGYQALVAIGAFAFVIQKFRKGEADRRYVEAQTRKTDAETRQVEASTLKTIGELPLVASQRALNDAQAQSLMRVQDGVATTDGPLGMAATSLRRLTFEIDLDPSVPSDPDTLKIRNKKARDVIGLVLRRLDRSSIQITRLEVSVTDPEDRQH
jgi:hypothetical protein